VIYYYSHIFRRVARLTKTAETPAASDGYDRAYYVESVLTWMEIRYGILLVLDRSSLFADVSSTRTPKEERLMVALALLRESFENGDLGAVIWAETTAQLADAMTMFRCQILGGAIHRDFLVVHSFDRSAQQNRDREA
jgi:hypothetical protein